MALVEIWLESLRRGAWAPVLVVLLHALVSFVGGYERWPSLDVPAHIAGGIAITYFFSHFLFLLEQRGLFGSVQPSVRNLFLIALTGTAAVVWEFVEFLSDASGMTASQKGLPDTLLDMALGLVGGIVFLVARTGQSP